MTWVLKPSSIEPLATADLVPDATLLLSVPLSAEQERMDQRGTVDRIEAEGAAFKARIHGAFEQIAPRGR